jgi:hypothetical protein
MDCFFEGEIRIVSFKNKMFRRIFGPEKEER